MICKEYSSLVGPHLTARMNTVEKDFKPAIRLGGGPIMLRVCFSLKSCRNVSTKMLV